MNRKWHLLFEIVKIEKGKVVKVIGILGMYRLESSKNKAFEKASFVLSKTKLMHELKL